MEEEATKGQKEFNEWLLHPTTKLLMAYLKREKDDVKERWAAGEFTDQSQFATAIVNAKAVGKCEAYSKIESIEYGDIEEQQDE